MKASMAAIFISMALLPFHADSVTASVSAPVPCDEDWVDAEVTSLATESTREVLIDCDLILAPSDVVTKRLVLEGAAATDVIINCNGATIDGGPGTVNYQPSARDQVDMIEIRSRQYELDGRQKWERPENVTIANCNVFGSVRILSAKSISVLKNHSQLPDYVDWARDTAPTNITLDNLTITGLGRIPMYFSVGVSNSALINSEITGESVAVAVYLDAESTNNLLKYNNIHVNGEREQVAIDASSNNKLVNNYFSGLDTGGVYLYRNCGESGIIRHTTPSYNTILNNVFYYNRYTEDQHPGETLTPAIYVGSRNGDDAGAGYCDEDEDAAPFGSSVSNLDYATGNVIMQNQIFKRNLDDAIRSRNWTANSPNYIDHNETVTKAVSRFAGCTIGGTTVHLVLDGQIVDLADGPDGTGPYLCSDGELIFLIALSDQRANALRELGSDLAMLARPLNAGPVAEKEMPNWLGRGAIRTSELQQESRQRRGRCTILDAHHVDQFRLNPGQSCRRVAPIDAASMEGQPSANHHP